MDASTLERLKSIEGKIKDVHADIRFSEREIEQIKQDIDASMSEIYNLVEEQRSIESDSVVSVMYKHNLKVCEYPPKVLVEAYPNREFVEVLDNLYIVIKYNLPIVLTFKERYGDGMSYVNVFTTSSKFFKQEPSYDQMVDLTIKLSKVIAGKSYDKLLTTDIADSLRPVITGMISELGL